MKYIINLTEMQLYNNMKMGRGPAGDRRGSAIIYKWVGGGGGCRYGGGVSSREQRSRARSRRGGGLGKPDHGLSRGETFFPDDGSDCDSDETFQISRNLGLIHVEFISLLDSQPWLKIRDFYPGTRILILFLFLVF